MKRKLCLIVLCVWGLGAVSQAQQPEPPRVCAPEESAASLEVVMGWVASLLGQGGAPDVSAFWSDDSLIIVPEGLPYGGSYSLAEQVEYAAAIANYWTLGSMSAPDLYAACDKVFLRSDWVATANASGVEVNTPLLEVFTVRDGKIVQDELFFFDLDIVLEALDIGR